MHAQLCIHFTSGSCAGTLLLTDEVLRVGEEDLHRWIDDAITAGCSRLEVDCSRVTHAERPSLVVLSAAKARLEGGGGWLLVTQSSPSFARTVQPEGFGELLDSALASGSDGERNRKQHWW